MGNGEVNAAMSSVGGGGEAERGEVGNDHRRRRNVRIEGRSLLDEGGPPQPLAPIERAAEEAVGHDRGQEREPRRRRKNEKGRVPGQHLRRRKRPSPISP